MMVLDGVTGALTNATHRVEVSGVVRLVERGGAAPAPERVVAEVALQDGDGMCMGYHAWRTADFGPVPIVAPGAP